MWEERHDGIGRYANLEVEQRLVDPCGEVADRVAVKVREDVAPDLLGLADMDVEPAVALHRHRRAARNRPGLRPTSDQSGVGGPGHAPACAGREGDCQSAL